MRTYTPTAAEKILYARRRGANVSGEGVTIGPQGITPKTLPNLLEELYNSVRNLGFTYSGRPPKYDYFVASRFRRGDGAFISDDPVGIYTIPKMDAEKLELHNVEELVGWDLSKAPRFGNIALVDVRAPSAIEIMIIGVRGRRFERAESVVRNVLARYQ